MARPQKEGLEYFPHDVYASSDEKIEPLILLYGSKGYSFYFLHLEYIYRNKELFFDVSDAETREVICQKLRINTEEYEQILHTALKKGCFDREYYQETGRLTSNGVKKRAAIVTEKREKMRQKYESKRQNISDAETREETTPETPQSKVKESKDKSKVKESINKIHYAENVSMTEEEYQKLSNGHGQAATKGMIDILNNYKGANGKRYKSDYLAILNWVVKRYYEESSKPIKTPPKNPGKYDIVYLNNY